MGGVTAFAMALQLQEEGEEVEDDEGEDELVPAS